MSINRTTAPLKAVDSLPAWHEVQRPAGYGSRVARLLSAYPDAALLIALGVLMVFRVWLAATLPLTADEAYYVDTGRHPDWGIYDHPAMIAWWLAAFLKLGDSEWWLRMPSILLPIVFALATRRVLPRVWPGITPERACLAAAMVAFAPLNVWGVMVATDTPLVFFTVLSGLAWMLATRTRQTRWYLLCGTLLAGALLSKYFAFLIAAAFLAEALVARDRRTWTGLALVYACTLPAFALMAWWNLDHCWANLLFNFYNRTSDAALSWESPAVFLVMLAYVLTPPALMLLPGQRVAAFTPDTRATTLLSLVPFGFFALLSLGMEIGLHWVLAFVPFAFLPLARHLPIDSLRRLGTFVLGVATAHVVVFVVLAQLPLESWKWSRHYDGVVTTYRPGAILSELEPYSGQFVFGSDNYALASTLGYARQRTGGERFITIGKGSYHGRQDDLDTDFRALDGRDILIVSRGPSALDTHRPYFRDVKMHAVELNDAQVWVVLGRGFRYATYRDTVLADIRDRLYALPSWLPKGRCYFCDRYFGGQVPTR